MKYSFFDIHPECAHPEILAYISKHNVDHFIDPDTDMYQHLGAEKIKKAFGIPDAKVHYLPNGTITNVIALSSMLQPFEGVISPSTGHINKYEAGAFEATGHKIITVESEDGKLNPDLIDNALKHYINYQTVVPRVVYLTQVTEQGTVYTRGELMQVIAHAKQKGLLTYLDGARLAMALASKTASISLKEFGSLDLDMFYLGGTKNGGLYGEALVIKNDTFTMHFPNHMKQRGGDMSKQRFMSLQFARFFDDDNLWLRLGAHANSMARMLSRGLAEMGAQIAHGVDANNVFVVMSNTLVAKLEEDYGLARWEEVDTTTTKVRLVCSWSTKIEEVEDFLQTYQRLLHA